MTITLDKEPAAAPTEQTKPTLFGQAGLPRGGLAKVFLFGDFEN